MVGYIQRAVSSSGLPSTTEVWNYWWEFSEGRSSEDIPAKMIKGLFNLDNTSLGVDFIEVYLQGRCKKNGARLFSLLPSDRRGSGHKLKHTRCGLSEHQKEIFCCEGDFVLVAQRYCGSFFRGDIQKLCDHHCRQLAAHGHARVRGWTRWPLEVIPTSMSLFCDTFRHKNNLFYNWLNANSCKAIICIFSDISINFQTNKKKAFPASKSINEHFKNSLSNLSSVMRSNRYSRKQNI